MQKNDVYLKSLPQIAACLAQHGFQAAWDLLAEMQQQLPENAAVFHLQGNMLFETGRYAEAIKSYFHALAMTPNDARLLADTGSAWQMLANFPQALTYYRAALTWQLCEPQTFSAPAQPTIEFDKAHAEQQLWQVLAQLAHAGIHAFATSGVLLGLVREGHLLPFDKDLDIGLPFNELEAAKTLLLADGWRLLPSPKGMQTPIMLGHPNGMALDLCAFRVEPETGQTVSGFWVEGTPPEWHRVTVFPTLNLVKRASPYGPVWHLREPESVLTALYGPDWRIPDPDFDTVVSAYNQRGFSLITHCYAASRLYWHWSNGRHRKALSIARHSLRQLPDDGLLQQANAYLTSYCSQSEGVS